MEKSYQKSKGCKPPATTMSDLRAFAKEFRRALRQAASCRLPSQSGLRNFRLGSVTLLGSYTSLKERGLRLSFESDGVNRTLTYLIGRAQEVDLAGALAGRAVSTIALLGLSSLNSQLSVDQLCGEARRTTDAVRVLYSPNNPDFQRKGPRCARYGWEPAARNDPTADLSKDLRRCVNGAKWKATNRLSLVAAKGWLVSERSSRKSTSGAGLLGAAPRLCHRLAPSCPEPPGWAPPRG